MDNKANAESFAKKVSARLQGIDTLTLKSELADEALDNIAQTLGETEKIIKMLDKNLQDAENTSVIVHHRHISSHRKGIGSVVVFLKKVIRKLVKVCLGWYIYPMIDTANQFNGKMINVARLERDLLCSVVGEINAVKNELEKVNTKLKAIDSDVYLMKNIPTPEPEFYHQFEEEFRGSREDIVQRLQVYVPRIKEIYPNWEDLMCIDIGSGRGEWLDILRGNGCVDYLGIDLNPVQNKIAESFGHVTLEEDALESLKNMPDESVNLITGFQIIEHLYAAQLMVLFKECYRVLKKGGAVLFETQNPRNLIVGASTYYIDMDHKKPLHPLLTRNLVSYYGFDAEIIDSNSNTDWAGVPLPEKNSEQYELTEKFNEMCWLMYGPMDYAILGVKEKEQKELSK